MDNIFNLFFTVNPYKNLTQAELNNKLLELSSTGDLSKVTAVLGHGADINATDSYGSNALMIACRNGHTGTVAFLLQNGTGVNATDSHGDNALILACGRGHTDVAVFLLQNGADINAKNIYGNNALMIACTYDHTDTAAVLLQNGADINAKNNFDYNALMIACSNGYTGTAYLLLNRMTPEEQEAFANRNNDALNLVNGFKENLHKNALKMIYGKMRFERWKIQPNSIFQLLPSELCNYIRDFEAQLSVKEKFKDSWYRFCAFSDMNLVTQCCALYSIDKPIFPVLFLSNKRKAQGEPEENNNSNKRMHKIEEEMEIDENSNESNCSIQ